MPAAGTDGTSAGLKEQEMGRREEPPGIQKVGSRLFGGDGQFFPAYVPMGGNVLRLRRGAGAIP